MCVCVCEREREREREEIPFDTIKFKIFKDCNHWLVAPRGLKGGSMFAFGWEVGQTDLKLQGCGMTIQTEGITVKLAEEVPDGRSRATVYPYSQYCPSWGLCEYCP